MRIRILGPLEVRHGQEWQRLSAPKWRGVLAALLVGPGGPVSIDRLTDELWPATPPNQATNQIHGYVSRLRRVLGDVDGRVLATRSPGYELRLEPGDVDAEVFERLAAQGEAALRDGEVARAGRLLVQALDLWRGPALADVPPTPAVQAEADRLEERRLAVVEARIETELLQGRHAELIAQLQALVEAQPLREGFWAQLMLGLYRSGRQADALAAYQRLYQLLDEELGVQPGARLRDLQQRILRADPDLARAEAYDSVPHQLPADTADFTGRAEELRRLDALLAGSGTVVIGSVTGTGGVGKTTLAVHWAHRRADRFPDGQLYLDLRGYARTPPLETGQALAQLLRGLGVPPDSVPLHREEAAALYRSLLDGRQVLVVLDNAADAGQVRALVPGSPGCAVIVTSRSRLGGLVARDGARQLDLDRLPQDHAVALLANVLGESRVAQEPAAVAELASLCGGIPLPLRIAAANLAADPYLQIADYVAVLRKHDRLEHLQIEGDPETAVRAVFELSYRRLAAADRQLFRMLSLMPGTDFGAEAVGALTGAEPAAARRDLARLLDGHLIERRAPDRYGFHDLMRLYATERCADEDTEDDRRAALARLLDWYVATTYAATSRLIKPDAIQLPAAPTWVGRAGGFADHTRALEWLEAERTQLVAATGLAAELGWSPHAPLLADALRWYLHYWGYGNEWLTVARLGLAAAEARGNEYGEVAARISLAQASTNTDERASARTQIELALKTAQRVGWAEAEAFIRNQLGVLYADDGRLGQAVEQWGRAVALAQSLGRQATTARLNLAVAYSQMGRLDRALEADLQNVQDARMSGSLISLGVNLADLAKDHRLVGNYQAARECLAEALEIGREVGSRRGIFGALVVHIDVASDCGREDSCRQALQECAQLVGSGDRQHELEAQLQRLRGDAALRAGDREAAVREYRTGIEYADEFGFHYESVECRVGGAFALVRLAAAEAVGAANDAVRAARDAGYGLLEAQALMVLGRALLNRRDPAAAREAAGQALRLHRSSGHRLGQARTLRLLAEIAGDPGTAAEHAQQARAIFAELGVPERI